MHATPDRRASRRLPMSQARRRYGRGWLDVDWFVDGGGASAMGRGLELTPRSALVPASFTSLAVEAPVLLHVALPARARLFRAECHLARRMGRGLLLRFEAVPDEDMQLLGESLVEALGPAALPGLERKFRRLTELPPRHFRGH
ncbi:MAG: hypothetical protein RL653_222 [Pseudomonadota bacterium]